MFQKPVDYDCIILGGGLSGLAAGIRLAHFGWRVRIFEKQSQAGGLNSFYARNGYLRDTGLHAMTNFALPCDKGALLNRLFRQLRLNREEFGLVPQTRSEIRFPSKTLVLNNDFQAFACQVQESFPEENDGFRQLCERISQEAYRPVGRSTGTGRQLLDAYLKDETLKDMLLMPVMFYGNPCSQDMDRSLFCTIFRSVLMEGLGRPKSGMADFVKRLENKYLQEGGELSLGLPVVKLSCHNGRMDEIMDALGAHHSARKIISTLGLPETEQLLKTSSFEKGKKPGLLSQWKRGQIAFVEMIVDLACAPSDLGLDACVIFQNEASRLCYAPPVEPVDFSSSLICAPGNYRDCGENYDSCVVRISHLANSAFWLQCSEEEYRAAKAAAIQHQLAMLEANWPGISSKIRNVEMFTPKTVQRFAGRLNGAIYGCEQKLPDGKYPGIENLTIAGTDQGGFGIVGAMVSGMTAATGILTES